jgi:CDP-glucose 4,6-dehydratase
VPNGSQPSTLNALCSAFNFGPALTSNRTVATLVQEVLKHWPARWEDRSDPRAVHEANLLNLATDKAFHLLHWQPIWSFEQTIAQTVAWYRRCGTQLAATETCAFTKQQITEYTTAASEKGLRWVK